MELRSGEVEVPSLVVKEIEDIQYFISTCLLFSFQFVFNLAIRRFIKAQQTGHLTVFFSIYIKVTSKGRKQLKC